MKKKFLILMCCILCLSCIGCRKIEDSVMSSEIVSKTENTNHKEINNDINDASTLTDNINSETVCIHKNIKKINEKKANCITEGYTGDDICTDCGVCVENGKIINKTTLHNTELRNVVKATSTTTGYSGDTYCKDCGVKLGGGNIIPYIIDGDVPMRIWKAKNGLEYTVPEGTDILKYTIAINQIQPVEHQYFDIEKEIFKLCNEERLKAGFEPLEWIEETYPFVVKRAQECQVFYSPTHQRPDKSEWYTVYHNAGIIIGNGYGEINNKGENISIENIAKELVVSWMNSTKGHREAILNPEYKRTTIAVIVDDKVCYATQHFYT